MSIDTLLRLERTVLFQQLIKKEKESGLGYEISERVKSIVGYVAPLLARVPDKMPEYTLHDANHSAKVVELMSQIIPEETLTQLNVIELSMLIYAGYLHDIGMTCNSDEREEIISNSAEFMELLLEDTDRYESYKKYLDQRNTRTATFIQDQVFTEYLRRNHVKRTAEFIEKHFSSGELSINWQGTPYSKHVIAICDSHGMAAENLANLVKWPRDALIRNLRVNIQYLSIILRMADILDLDPERTPKSVFEFINPEDPNSIVEWKKHRSILGWEITPERIRFEAECSDPQSERALREFLDWIEYERKESLSICSKYKDQISQIYQFNLTEPVSKERIFSNGNYIFSNLKFAIDYKSVMKLLMGDRLYQSPVFALRELIQNSVDAIKYRGLLESHSGNYFEPKLKIVLNQNELIIEDNGIGMDQRIFEKYFIQVGRSYYSSPEFTKENYLHEITSEFGIGILSAFMIAKKIKVESRRRPNNDLSPQEPIDIEIPTAFDFFIQKPSTKKDIGTKITLSLKTNHPFSNDIENTITNIFPFRDIPITLCVDGKVVPIEKSSPLEVEFNERLLCYLEIPIDFEDSNQKCDIKGKLFIVSTRDPDDGIIHYPIDGVIAQKGFRVGRNRNSFDITNSVNSILPSWVSVYPKINIKGTRCLTLTPDRLNIIENDNSEYLKEVIETIVAKALDEHLKLKRKELSIEEYYNYFTKMRDDYVLLHSISERKKVSVKSKEMLIRNSVFPVIDSKGMITYLSSEQINEHDNIVMIDKDQISNDILLIDIWNSVNDIFNLRDIPILFLDRRADDFAEFLFGGVQTMFITKIPGVVLSVIRKNYSGIENFYLRGDMYFCADVNCLESSHQVLLSYDPFAYSFRFPTYNYKHPLLSSLIDIENPTNDQQENLLLTFNKKVTKIISKYVAELHGITNFDTREWGMGFSNPNKQLKGLLKKDEHFISAIRICAEEMWQKAVECGLIVDESPCPVISVTDFPWFWWEEYEQ